MRSVLPFGFGIFIILILILSCEKREIWLETAEEASISALKSNFEAKRIAFESMPDKPDYNFRQELQRTIHWDRSHQSEDGRYFVPLTLTLEGEHARFSNGTHTYPYQTVLMIDPRDQQPQYTLLTFFPDDPAASTFTGVLLFEDYFLGNTQMAHFKDGVSIRFHENDPLASELSMAKSAGGGTHCYWLYTGTVCVLDLDYGGAPEICSPQYDFVCIGIPPDIPDETYDPEEGGSGGGGSGGGTSGGADNGAPSEHAVKDQIKEKPFALIDIPCEIIEAWVATATKEVQQAQINKLNQMVSVVPMPPDINIYTVARLQDINDAHSAVVNMDYFPVKVTQLPIINGIRQTPEQFLEFIRKNINSFVDTDYAEFEPYQWYGVNDVSLWNSSNPLGAVIALDISGPDNGSVIVSDYSSTGWTFSTIYDPMYASHPVSGHRDFGFTVNGDGSYTFYTRGVDRLTNAGGTALHNISMFLTGQSYPFSQADALWTSFQSMINSFVNQNGGNSSISAQQIHRPNWQQVIDVIDGRAPLSSLSKDCPDQK